MADRVHGNSEVIELLEIYLDVARNNDFGHVAIAMVGHPSAGTDKPVGAMDFAGENSLQLQAKEALGVLTKRLDDSLKNWALPPQDENLDASYACYNAAFGPLGYDFVVWLIDREMVRRRAGAPAPLKVGFWLGKNEQASPNRDIRLMWLTKVFRPALGLIGAVEDEQAIYGGRTNVYVARPIVDASRAGEDVPIFKSPLRVKPRHVGAVTITLRESDHWPHRNSDLEAWLKFAEHLRDQGRRVVFVRDTAKAFEPLGDFMTDPLASKDLQIRMALYEGAEANLFISNGPATLALFSDRPWLQFIRPEDEKSAYRPATAKGFEATTGVKVGEQYPWSAADQRLVWATDTYENILAAWNGLELTERKPKWPVASSR